MPPSIEIGTEPPADWNTFVDAHGSFYHRAEWAAALGGAFGFRLRYVVARDARAIAGVLPVAVVRGITGRRRLVSLPFSYATGPLTTRPEVDAALSAAALDVASREGIGRVELKRRGPLASAPVGFTRVSHYLTYVVPTDGGEDAVWKRLHANHIQRGIRKGEKSVTVERVADAAGWARMAALQQDTARRLGLPAPPDAFFTRHVASLAARGLAECLLAVAPTGERVAGIVLWRGARELIYAFGASLPEHWHLRPNHALLWSALRQAVRDGIPFDLGRAAPEQVGLTEFKQRWGGAPLPLAHDYWPVPSGLNTRPRDRGALAVAGRAWARLPLAVTRRASFLYRYLG